MDARIVHTSEIQLMRMLLRSDTCTHTRRMSTHQEMNRICRLLGINMRGFTILQSPLDQACYTLLPTMRCI